MALTQKILTNGSFFPLWFVLSCLWMSGWVRGGTKGLPSLSNIWPWPLHEHVPVGFLVVSSAEPWEKAYCVRGAYKAGWHSSPVNGLQTQGELQGHWRWVPNSDVVVRSLSVHGPIIFLTKMWIQMDTVTLMINKIKFLWKLYWIECIFFAMA